MEAGEATCRTCGKPIWNEGGTVGGQGRAAGWSDRIERGGDSLVCFSAHNYRHVPMSTASEEGCASTYNVGRGLWLHCSGKHLVGNVLRDENIVHQQQYGGIDWTWYSDEADRTIER